MKWFAGAQRPRTEVRRPAALALLATVFVLGLPQAASAGAVLVVNDDSFGPGPGGIDCSSPDHSTIQDALDAITPGGTIFVCAGQYSEAGGSPAAIVHKSITLRGAQADNDARSREGIVDNEAVVQDLDGGFDIQPNVDNVSINGFTVQGAADPGIFVRGGGSGYSITNNIVRDNSQGLFLSTELAGVRTIVRHNRFDDNNRATFGQVGVAISSGELAKVRIDENLFTDHDYFAMLLDGGTGATLGSSVSVTANRLTQVYGGVRVSDLTDVLIRDNLIRPLHDGVLLDGGNEDIAIARNDIRGGGGAAVILQDRGSGLVNKNVDVTGNTLMRSLMALGVLGQSLDGTLEAHFNRIVGNRGNDVFNQDLDDLLNVRNSWWGCNAGPGAQGCDSYAASRVRGEPHLVLKVKSAKRRIGSDERTRIKARLDRNSAGRRLSDCEFPDGTTIRFRTSRGKLSTRVAGTQNCVAKTTLRGAGEVGKARVRASLDGQPVKTVVRIRP